MGAPAAAQAGTLIALTARSGGRSSLSMLTMALLGDPTLYEASAERVTTTLSTGSTMSSSMASTVTLASLAPSAMVTLPDNPA
jgi:hypothetical protein